MIEKRHRKMRHDLGDRSQGGHAVTIDEQLLSHAGTCGNDGGGRVA